MLKKFKILSFITMIICIFPALSFANSVLINNSNKTWIVQYIPYSSDNVLFIGSSCHTGQPCYVQPHLGIKVVYPDGSGGTIIITDPEGVSKSFAFRPDRDHYIKHNGRTGGAYLNEPYAGDITIGEDKW